jgi:MFS family permease
VESGILGPAEGYITDRLGPRRVILIGLTLCVLGFVGLSLVNSLPAFYLVVVLGIVLGSSLAFFIPVSVVVATLFRARRGLAFGIFRMGPGLAGALVPLVGWSIGRWGWRITALSSACILLATGTLLARIVGRSYEAYRKSADDASTGSKPAAELHTETIPAESSARVPEIHFTLKEALGTSAFWMLAVATGLRHMVTEGVSVHFVVLLVDRGWSQQLASSMLGLSALIGAPARIAIGWLGDFVDKRRLMMGLLIALGMSVFFMGSFTERAVFMPFMVIYSLAYGGLAALQEAIRADYFGTRSFASIQGFSRMIVTAGTFLGPLSAGFFFDLTRSYRLAFSSFAVVSLVSTLLMLLGKPPQPPAPKRSEAGIE